jgi:hypothetical protein
MVFRHHRQGVVAVKTRTPATSPVRTRLALDPTRTPTSITGIHHGAAAVCVRGVQDNTRVLPLVSTDKPVEKSEFEVILNEILTCLHENTQIDIDVIAQKTRKVITDLPNEYGQLPKDLRSWELMIGYLYAMYLKDLGRM